MRQLQSPLPTRAVVEFRKEMTRQGFDFNVDLNDLVYLVYIDHKLLDQIVENQRKMWGRLENLIGDVRAFAARIQDFVICDTHRAIVEDWTEPWSLSEEVQGSVMLILEDYHDSTVARKKIITPPTLARDLTLMNRILRELHGTGAFCFDEPRTSLLYRTEAPYSDKPRGLVWYGTETSYFDEPRSLVWYEDHVVQKAELLYLCVLSLGVLITHKQAHWTRRRSALVGFVHQFFRESTLAHGQLHLSPALCSVERRRTVREMDLATAYKNDSLQVHRNKRTWPDIHLLKTARNLTCTRDFRYVHVLMFDFFCSIFGDIWSSIVCHCGESGPQAHSESMARRFPVSSHYSSYSVNGPGPADEWETSQSATDGNTLLEVLDWYADEDTHGLPELTWPEQQQLSSHERRSIQQLSPRERSAARPEPLLTSRVPHATIQSSVVRPEAQPRSSRASVVAQSVSAPSETSNTGNISMSASLFHRKIQTSRKKGRNLLLVH